MVFVLDGVDMLQAVIQQCSPIDQAHKRRAAFYN
jgi:hypothetical protein